MHIDLITALPDLVRSPLEDSIIKRAVAAGYVSINVVDLREFATGRHRQVDDYPYGGGAGMVLKPEPLFACLEALMEGLEPDQIDKVVGIESRGFFFGTLLAHKLDAGFIPVRKPGKLPFTTIREDYKLEYGTDAVEIHSDAIAPGDRVLIHDDVLATGGTAQAVCKLVERLGGDIVECNFIMELQFLGGVKKLNGYNHRAVLTY